MKCKDCKHWDKNEYDSSSDQDNTRTCYMIEDNSQSMIIIGADDDYGLGCATYKDFGCTLFEPK